METQVVNRRMSEFDVYIGRGSEWGNDYSHREGTKAKFLVESREEAIACYKRDLWRKIQADPERMIPKLAALRGKRLGCYCAPLACHGDVLAMAAEWAAKESGR